MNSKQKILIVDDEAVNIHVLYNLLKDDYQVAVALGGNDALELLEGEALPDLILLDITMPDMDGYEVCRRIKAAESTADIPVIFVSAADGEEDEVTGFELGAADYVTKPIRPSILTARVKTHLELRRKYRELQESIRVFENKITLPARIRQQDAASGERQQVIRMESFFRGEDLPGMAALEQTADTKIGRMCGTGIMDEESVRELKEALSQYGAIITGYPEFRDLGDALSRFAAALRPAGGSVQLILASMEVMIFTLLRWREQLQKGELIDIHAYDNALMNDFKTIVTLLEQDVSASKTDETEVPGLTGAL